MLRIVHSSGSKLRHVPANVVKSQTPASFLIISKSGYHTSNNAKSSIEPMRFIKNIYDESPFLQSVAPKGFGKYFPREGGEAGSKKADTAGTGSKSSTESSTQQKTAGSIGGDKKTGGGNSGGSGKKPDPSDKMKFGSAAALGFLALVGLLTMDNLKNGHEISYQDFQRQLLEAGLVDRIIVTNKNVAKIVLRMPANEKELNMMLPQTIRQGGQSGQSGSMGQSAFPNDSLTPFDENSSAFGSAEGEGGDSKGGRAPFARYPSLGAPNNLSTPYYFNISTVDTFERRLEESQIALGIAPRDFIPVIYVSETSWTNELLRLMPTVLLIGATFLMILSLIHI